MLLRTIRELPRRWFRSTVICFIFIFFGFFFLFELWFYKKSYFASQPRDSAFIEKIRNATISSWNAYKACAWGMDIVLPVKCEGMEWMDAGLTMIDSLDTLWIMNLNKEFDEARNWIAENLNFTSSNKRINVFETTIRILGGLLSTYTLTKDQLFLQKATNLGDILLGAFEGDSVFPTTDIQFSTRKGYLAAEGRLSLAEVASIQLEFNELSRLTKNEVYALKAGKVYKRLHEFPKENGLLPIEIDAYTGEPDGNYISIGARGDSYYEYLLKVWLQTGKVLNYLESDYKKAIEGIQKLLVRYSSPNHLLFIGELGSTGNFIPTMDHLVCFLPGTLAYGVLHGMPETHLILAENLIRTCYEMYDQTFTHLSPDVVTFNTAMGSKADMQAKNGNNILRPETMESLYYLYTITKNPKYQAWGRNIMNAFDRYSKLPKNGYTGLQEVSKPSPQRIDKMESFWIAETLKYAYLLFDEDAASQFPLEHWVFNTEAHPLPLTSEPPSLLSSVYAQLKSN